MYMMEYYSGTKRNETGAFEDMVDLETVIHSEVSQKEKNKYHILMHICEIWKSGINDLIHVAEIETQT